MCYMCNIIFHYGIAEEANGVVKNLGYFAWNLDDFSSNTILASSILKPIGMPATVCSTVTLYLGIEA